MKKYILLDWDGNLAKTLDVWLVACRKAIEAQGISKTDEEIASSFGQFEKHLTEWGVKDVNQAIEFADKIAKQELPNVELYPDALIVLEKLHARNLKIALITTSPHENITHLLEKHSLLQYFDVIIAGDDVKHHKPHPEPLEKAIHELNGNKNEAVMVGDSDKDLTAAKNAGIDSVLFYPPEHKKFYDFEKLKSLSPTHTMSDFRDLLNLV